MKKLFLSCAITALTLGSAVALPVWAESAEEFYKQGQEAYSTGQLEQAIGFYQKAIQLESAYTDAYFNLGAIYFNLKRYPEALEAFNKLLQQDPNDQAARYESARVLDTMGRTDEAITAYGLITPASSRFSKAQENLSRLKAAKASPVQVVTAITTTQSSAFTSMASSSTPIEAKHSENSKTTAQTASPMESASYSAPGKAPVQEFATGFYGPTGVAVDAKGIVYVANFSKNTIYKVSPAGKKELLASGAGINGPVGMTLDNKTGDLYIANHLDNTIARITPNGKVSVIATGLKKPYNIYLDESRRMLYVSQQETNSIAKVSL